MKYAPPIGQEAQGESAHYIDGNPELGILGSPVPAAAIEPCQRELVHVLRQAGLTPSAEDLTQLYQAICKIIGAQVPLASKTAPGLMQVGAGLTVTETGLVAVENKGASLLTCATAGAVAVKEVELEGFSLTPGARLDVIFSEVNSAVTPMLSVNEGISKPILFDGVAPEVGDMAKNQIYTLAYTGSAWQIMAGMARDRIGQTVWFEDTLSRPGYAPLNGGIVANFAATWPQAMAYLQTSHGQARCFASLDEREAAHVAIWHTLASGATVGWEGVGGLTKFFYDPVTDQLYLPDLRGMFRAAAGDGIVAPSAGGVAGDRIRGMQGYIRIVDWSPSQPSTGPFVTTPINIGPNTESGSSFGGECFFDPGRVVPTGAVNAPRSWGALACTYLGQPTTA